MPSITLTRVLIQRLLDLGYTFQQISKITDAELATALTDSELAYYTRPSGGGRGFAALSPAERSQMGRQGGLASAAAKKTTTAGRVVDLGTGGTEEAPTTDKLQKKFSGPFVGGEEPFSEEDVNKLVDKFNKDNAEIVKAREKQRVINLNKSEEEQKKLFKDYLATPESQTAGIQQELNKTPALTNVKPEKVRTTEDYDKETADIVAAREKAATAEQRIEQKTARERITIRQNTAKQVIELTKEEQRAQEAAAKAAQEAARNAGVAAKYPNAVQNLTQQDPRFAGDTASLSTKDLANQHTRVTSSFRDEYDQVQRASVVVDKYGNAINTTSRRLRSFGEQIVANYGEVFKWSLAVGLLYGPMQKLNELVTNMIQNQTRLAQITVTLGTTQAVTNEIFAKAAQIAKDTGTDLEGVIQGYDMAFRAQGDATNQAERLAKASTLLKDSIILSKLANIEQSEATDILTASIKQMNDPLMTTGMLLDKWVAISKIANVDVNTLATSFSIVAEAAQAAGLSIDELNGLIAVIAEKSGLSAKEVGNSVRAIISGFQTDAAAKELQKFGIAVKDIEGNTRGFKEVFGDLQSLTKQGLIGEDQLSNIARIMGGGNRRQAQEIMAIMGFERMGQVAGVSETAQPGTAGEALATLMDTIQPKLNALNVAFGQLAQALGTEGGLLGIIQTLVEGTTKFVDALTSLVKVFGTAIPFMTAIGLTGLLAPRGSPLNIAGNMMGSVGRGIGGVGSAVGGAISGATSDVLQNPKVRGWSYALFGNDNPQKTFTDLGGKIATGFREHSTEVAAVIGTSIASFIAIAMRAGKGDTSGAFTTGGAALAGGLIGALGGPMGIAVGITIGTSIGEALASNVEQNKQKFQAALGQGPQQYYTPEEQGAVVGGKTLSTKEQAAYFGQGQAPTPGSIEDFLAKVIDPQKQIAESYQKINQQYEEWLNKPENKLQATETVNGVAKVAKLTPDELMRQMATTAVDVTGMQNIKYKGFEAQIQRDTNFKPMSTEQYDALFKAAAEAATKAKSPIEQSPYLTKVVGTGGFGDQYRDFVKQLQDQALQVLDTELQMGQIGAKAKQTTAQGVSMGAGKAIQMAYPLTPEAGFGGLMTAQDALKKAVDIIAKGTDEETSDLTNYATSIKDLSDKIKAAETAGKEVEAVFDPSTGVSGNVSVARAKEILNQTAKNFGEMFNAIANELVNRTVIAPMLDYTKKGYTKEDIEKIIEPAADQWIKGMANSMIAANQPEQAQAFITQQDRTKGMWVTTANGMLYAPYTQEAMNAAEQAAIDAAKLKKNVNIQDVDMTMAKTMNALSAGGPYEQLLAKFQAKGYTPNLENMVLYTNDKQLTDMLKIDNKVFSELMKDMNDKLQKQLDGMYNLPSNSQFYVPYSAAMMSKETANAISPNIDLKDNTGALRDMSAALRAFKAADEASMKTLSDQGLMVKKFNEADKASVDNYNMWQTQQQGGKTLPGIIASEQGKFGVGGPDLAGVIASELGKFGNINITPAPIKIELNSTTTLQLDGRVIAQIVKQEIAKSLAQFSGTGGGGGGGPRPNAF